MGGGAASPSSLANATSAFENPLGPETFDNEEDGAADAPFESEVDDAPVGKRALPTTKGIGAASSNDAAAAAAAAVVPESLMSVRSKDGAQGLAEAWKNSLVEQNTQVKENIRDKQRREAREKLAASEMIFDPDAPFRRKWDLAQMLLLVYVAFGVPYRLGFSHPVVIWTWQFWFDMCVDIYFISDIVVSCYTAYYDDVSTHATHHNCFQEGLRDCLRIAGRAAGRGPRGNSAPLPTDVVPDRRELVFSWQLHLIHHRRRQRRRRLEVDQAAAHAPPAQAPPVRLTYLPRNLPLIFVPMLKLCWSGC